MFEFLTHLKNWYINNALYLLFHRADYPIVADGWKPDVLQFIVFNVAFLVIAGALVYVCF